MNKQDVQFSEISPIRLKVMLQRQDGLVPSPWDVGNFIDNLSSYYYKLELINSVSLALNNGVLPQNILILDKSFKLNQGYTELKDFNICRKRIKNIYTIGKPISLYPNENIYCLSLLFETLRGCNERLFKFKNSTVSLDLLSKYTTLLFEEKLSLSDVVNMIVENAVSRIKKPTNSHLTSFKRLKEQIIDSFIKFKDDQKLFPQIENSLHCPTEKEFSADENKVVNRYYLKFFHFINKNSRPVVCIYHPETQNVEILGLSHINRNKRNSNFFDIKKITHSSPWFAELITGAANGLATVYKTLNEEERNEELHKLELQAKELEIEIKKQELEKTIYDKKVSEYQYIREKIELTEKMYELSQKHGENRAKEVQNPYIKYQALSAYQSIQTKSQKLLNANELEIVQIKEVSDKSLDLKI